MVDYYLLNTVPRMFHLQEWQANALSDERVLWNFRIRTKSGRPHTLRVGTDDADVAKPRARSMRTP